MRTIPKRKKCIAEQSGATQPPISMRLSAMGKVKKIRKRPGYEQRHDKLIFLHDNAPSHKSKMVQNYLETHNWEMLSHPAYSPDLAPNDYHLFSSMNHVLGEQHFDSLPVYISRILTPSMSKQRI